MATIVKEKAPKALNIEIGDDGVWVVKLDVPGEKVNTLSPVLFDEMTALLDRLEADPDDVLGVVIASGKPDGFVAGADVRVINAIQTAEEGEKLARQLQDVYNRIENLPMPTVVAIHGACLGGGLELALACRYRLASTDTATQLGLPEVQLGLIPGAGGTQRLPRLVGLRAALDMILASKRVRPSRAVKMGLVDEIVPKEILVERARVAARRIGEETRKKGRIPVPPASERRIASSVDGLLLEATIAGRLAIAKQAKAMLKSKVGKHYPAPYKALEAVMYTRGHSFEEGLALEARLFGELSVTDVSRSLIHLFFATTALKGEKVVKDGKVGIPRKVEKVGVLGGGLMGGGIATVLADKKVRVRVKDRDLASASKAMLYASRFLDGKVKRRHIRPYEKEMVKGLLSVTDDYSGFKRVDLVVEAVFEDMAIKHAVIKEVEKVVGPDTVFATNTSSLPIKEIAKASKHPENVVGMHFFSPVEKMPLLEVIVGEKSSADAVATAVALGKKMGKNVIVVNDGPGFYTTRALGTFMNEAIKLLLEGCSVEGVDKALLDFGFPVGPLTLMDEVGYDVGQKVLKTLTGAFGDRISVAPESKALLDSGRLGRKNAKGFYRYDLPTKKGKMAKEVDVTVYDGLPFGRFRTDQSVRVIQDRCVFAFLNEAAYILQEGILTSPRDGDIGAVFGLGFPPFLGGPFRYMDHLGLDAVVRRLQELEREYNKSFAPAELLVRMRDAGQTFFGPKAPESFKL